eukprot:1319156-Amorphochlora_amoeboformis.AAC.2
MPALVMLAMAVFAPLVLGQEPEEELDDVTIETLMKPYKCSDKVQVGDTIRIRHDGFWQGSKIDSDGHRQTTHFSCTHPVFYRCMVADSKSLFYTFDLILFQTDPRNPAA